MVLTQKNNLAYRPYKVIAKFFRTMAAEGDLDVVEEVAEEEIREGMAADEDAFGLGFDEAAMQDYEENKVFFLFFFQNLKPFF